LARPQRISDSLILVRRVLVNLLTYFQELSYSAHDRSSWSLIINRAEQEVGIEGVSKQVCKQENLYVVPKTVAALQPRSNK